jgi:ElaB/YqjD/DUF883 family membrane-anchored ribosome-binding protein
MTDFTIKTPAPKSSAKTTAKAGVKRAKAAVEKAVETVAEKAEVGKTWSLEKAKAAHEIAEERPVALAVGTFVAGLVFGFLLARNFDR